MSIHLSMLEEEVKKIYMQLNIHKPEQIQMKKIATAFKMRLHFEDIDGRMFYMNTRYRIVLNNQLPPEQQWEDFAHELCHVLKHCGNQFVMNKMFRQLQEFQASSFMYHFCVPTFMLSKMKLPQLKRDAVQLISDMFNVHPPPFCRKKFGNVLEKIV